MGVSAGACWRFIPDLLEWTRGIWDRRNVVDDRGPWEARLVDKSIFFPFLELSLPVRLVLIREVISLSVFVNWRGADATVRTGTGAEERVLAVFHGLQQAVSDRVSACLISLYSSHAAVTLPQRYSLAFVRNLFPVHDPFLFRSLLHSDGTLVVTGLMVCCC